MSNSTSGKNYIATKVFDENCDVCLHMSKHDKATFENFDEIAYQEISLDSVINHENNPTKVRLYHLLETHCLSPTYEIDLPVYLIMDRKGKYKGHQQGAATIVELRDVITGCLEKLE